MDHGAKSFSHGCLQLGIKLNNLVVHLFLTMYGSVNRMQVQKGKTYSLRLFLTGKSQFSQGRTLNLICGQTQIIEQWPIWVVNEKVSAKPLIPFQYQEPAHLPVKKWLVVYFRAPEDGTLRLEDEHAFPKKWYKNRWFKARPGDMPLTVSITGNTNLILSACFRVHKARGPSEPYDQYTQEPETGNLEDLLGEYKELFC